MYRRLEEFLRAKQAKYETVALPGVVTAQEQAAASHTPGWAMAKVVVVKERDGFVLAALPACCVLDQNRLKGLIGHGEIRLATLEEIGGVIADCAAGAIPPFGALFGVPTFVDRALLRGGEVTMPAGDPGTAVRMRTAEFRRLAMARVGDFSVPDSLVAGAAVAIPARAPRRRAGLGRRVTARRR
jgi:Ala-tRNA(Pro) deacylase